MSVPCVFAANIVIINNDGPGEGFRDLTPWTPTGGNPATTLGDARLNAFQYAADRWGELLVSNVTILVRANMDDQDCTPFAGILGSAGAVSFHSDFDGAELSGTWYPQALANAQHGSDLIPAHPDIAATFNSRLDGDLDCLLGAAWYLGFDRNPPAGDIDFVTVLMHEFAHGLGFLTVTNMITGEKFEGKNDSYMRHLEQAGVNPGLYANMTNSQRRDANTSDPDLRWRGENVGYVVANSPPFGGLSEGHARMYAPSQLQLGSSVSHWSTSLAPSEMMEPSYTSPDHTPGLATFLMADIGWELAGIVPVAFPGVTAVERGSALELRWDYFGNQTVRGFRIYRSDGVHGRERPLQDMELLEVHRRSYMDFDVKPGTSYQYTVAAVGYDGIEVRSPMARAELSVRRTTLAQNHPNPFNPKTEIRYVLSTDGRVRIVVYDVQGREVANLVDERQNAGGHVVLWDGRDAEGVARSRQGPTSIGS